MTKFVRRAQETGKELSFEATKMALDSCDLTLDQVDCVVHGTAPDAFDGVHMKGEYLADGSGAWRKPYTRCYVGGGTGVFAPIHGWYHVASGLFDICLVVCEEKMSSCQPHPQGAFLTIFDHTTERPLEPNLLWIFAMEMNRYMHTYGLKKEDIALVSVKNKRNAADHPCSLLGDAGHHRRGRAQLRGAGLAGAAPGREPGDRRRGGPGPGRRARGPAHHRQAGVDRGRGLEPGHRLLDQPRPVLSRATWRMRRAWPTTWPASPSHASRSTSPSPTTPLTTRNCTTWRGCMLFDRGKAPEATALGITQRDGDLPVCPSGGLLGVGNPIAAAGLMKVAELFWQLRGEAGARQVPGQPKRGVAQAWGDLMQVGTVVVMGV